ncbi:MAG: EAL domain-containing protein, partial [Gallionella sp.]|nr:EAL domain-containing protein [Gallionella sp.]
DTLAAASSGISDSARQIVDLVESDILTGRFTTSPEDFLMMVTTVIDDYYSQLHESLLPSAETLIQTRIAQAENALRASIGIASLLFLVVVYFTIGSYYATIGNIRSIARSARAFAGGDMDARVDLGTHDELRHVGDSFNEMADGFSALLAEQKQAEQLLRKSADEIEDLYNHAPCGYHSLDKDGIIIKINDTELAWLGYARDEIVGKMKWHDLLAPEDAADCGATFTKLMQFGSARDQEMHIKRKDGTVFTGLLNATAAYDPDGNYKMSRSTIFDITERKRAEAKMIELAYYDTLTGLPNRTLFYDRLAQEIKKAHRAGLKMAVLYIDLDKFKEVNDTLGHSMGDRLLVEAAQRINDCVREADTVARLGGDEFIIILSELDDAGSIERVAENILRKLAEPFQLGEEMSYISASMGITLYPDDATGVEELLKDADQAMYVAKNAGRNRLSYFTPALEQAAQSRLHLLNDLRGALAGGQFRVYYQPILDLATGRIDKAEALLRWQHPQRGMVSPAQFIPLAEESGLIVEIGDWVFREAAQQVKRWRTLYGPMFQISVNKSPTQFRQSGTSHETWLDYLRELGLPGPSIAIEITEGLLLDADSSVTDKLLEFRDAGMQVSIDDFGTGYSSLSYLKKFDIDYLKIDQSFVRDLVTDPNDRALSEAIIVMAHKLGLKVVAEGVETEAQRGLLSAAGCDYAQGYLFSRPVPPEEFETLMQSNWLIKAEGRA